MEKKGNFGEYNYSIDSEDWSLTSNDSHIQQGGNIIGDAINSIKSIFSGSNKNDAEKKIDEVVNKGRELLNKLKNNIKEFADKHFTFDFDICDVKDDNGQNVLHILASADKKEFNETNFLVKELFNSNICKSSSLVVNEKDNHGNTPLHYAVEKQNDEMVKELITHGAKIGVTNKDGVAVVLSSTESPKEIIKSESKVSPVNTVGGSEDTETFLNNLINKYNVNPKDDSEMSTDKFLDKLVDKYNNNTNNNMCGGNDSQLSDIDQFLNNIVNQKSADINMAGGNDDMDTEKFLNNIIDKYNNNNTNVTNNLNGGGDDFINELIKQFDVTENGTGEQALGKFINQYENTFANKILNKSTNVDSAYTYDQSEMSATEQNVMNGGNGADSYNTETFINSILNKINGSDDGKLVGGKAINGKRKMTQYDDNDGNNTKDGELSRIIRNKEKEIHKKVVNKISGIMNVDENTAKKYKSLLWKQVAGKYPHLVSDLDKSLQMEQLATKKNLNKLIGGVSSSSLSASSNTSDSYSDNKKNKKSTSSSSKSHSKSSSKSSSKKRSSDDNIKGGNYSPTSNSAVYSGYDSATSLD